MRKGIRSVSVFSPAKLNLFLAVTGKREDGFHNLMSLVSLVGMGDVVTLCPDEDEEVLECSCDHTLVPDGMDNLAAKAAEGWFRLAGGRQGVRIRIHKRIPVGGGLGGGSSNAVAVLKGLNLLAEKPLPEKLLSELAATLGSDCPLFLANSPCLIEGRGELVEDLLPMASARVSGRKVLLFAPKLSISAAEAFSALRSEFGDFSESDRAHGKVRSWLDGNDTLESILGNDLERSVFRKYPGIGILLEELRERFDWSCGMSGSGSCCFALLPEDSTTDEGKEVIWSAWGRGCFIWETVLV